MALRGVKVLDFSRVLAGPFCTMVSFCNAMVLRNQIISNPFETLIMSLIIHYVLSKQLLGDVGASILKIERPPKKCGSECETRGSRLWAARRGGGIGGGDDSRRFGPPFLPHSKEHLTDNIEDE